MSESSRILVELVEAQESALQAANELLIIKDEVISLLQDEITLRKKQNLALCGVMITCFVVFGFIASIYCIL